jgi:hypothetical protein
MASLENEVKYGLSFEHMSALLRYFPKYDVDALNLADPELRWIKSGSVIKLSSKIKQQDRELVVLNDMVCAFVILLCLGWGASRMNETFPSA